MQLKRFENAKKGSFWGLINKTAILIFPFIIRTVIIKVLGTEYLGLNGLFTSILNLLNLTELGIGSAIVFSMYEPIANDNTKKICALMNLYKKIYRYIGVVVLIIGLILVPFLKNFINGDIPNNINIYILYLIYLVNTIMTYWLFAYKNCLLQVHQRLDVINKIAIVTNFCMYAIQIFLLLKVKNYYIYIITLPIFTIINNIINAFIASKLYPQYKCEGMISKEELYAIKKKVMGLMVTKAAYISRNAFDSIVISAFLGLQAVAMYNNYYYICNSISAILTIFTAAIAAGVGNSLVLENKTKNLEDFRKINFIYMSISGICFTCMIVLYQPFMKLWVGENLLLNNITMILFALYFLVEKSLNVLGQYFDAAGLWWKGKWKGVIEAISNLILNIVLCKFFGMSGVVCATVITILFIGFPITAFYTYTYCFSKSAKKFIIEEYVYITAFICIGLLNFGILNLIPTGETIKMQICWIIIKLVVNIVITFIIYITIFYKTKIFKESIEWIKNRMWNVKKEKCI